MPHATPEQVQQQDQRRNSVRDAVFAHLADKPKLLRMWTRQQPLDPSFARAEARSIAAVVNINERHEATAVRHVETLDLRRKERTWLSPTTLCCPNTGHQPGEATFFCIAAVPVLKAIALTPAGWNDCWVMQQQIDDDEENPQLSPLHIVDLAAAAVAPLPYKAVFTPSNNIIEPSR